MILGREILKRKREYQEKVIHFQIPFLATTAKMWVFLDNGSVTYEHADEEADDLKSRGIAVEYTARQEKGYFFYFPPAERDTSSLKKKKKIKAQKLLKLQGTLGSLERSHKSFQRPSYITRKQLRFLKQLYYEEEEKKKKA